MTNTGLTAPLNTLMAREMIANGGNLIIEAVRLNGRLVWRPTVKMPDDPVTYRLVITNTMAPKYIKTFSGTLSYFQELCPDAKEFCVHTEVVEEITTE